MNGEDIKNLLPQRAPILMVDALLEVDGEEAQTSFTIPPGQLFLDAEGRLEATGLIEHIAQSASAFAGYQARQAGAAAPPVGYIGEVKHFRCLRRPCVGEELRTTIRMEAEAGEVRMLSGETCAGNDIVAATQLKIIVRPGS